ncbi:MAG: hypothetical protein WBA76_16975, partial [Phormidesmis sp.]
MTSQTEALGGMDGGELRLIQGREQAIAPVAHPYNRPGLGALSYRVGDYHRFRQKLMSHLSQPALPGGSTLAALTTRATDDSAIALLDAWAIMADVLTFYQERIANEGFLNTATERLSVLELARSIGYELDPGVAASTYLSFEVEDPTAELRTTEDPTVVIPLGTQVESVPGEGELPQLFETVEEMVARPEWSAIAPRSTRPQTITRSATELWLSGIDTQLQPGDWLLLVDRETPQIWRLLRLTEVVPDSATARTLVRWLAVIDAPADEHHSPSPLFHQPQVLAFRQTARLFGAIAPLWDELPNMTKRQALEAAASAHVVNNQINSETDSENLTPETLLFHGGVFRSGDSAENWLPLSSGLPDEDISSLSLLQDKTILAGSVGSGIFRQRPGAEWRSINQGLAHLSVMTLFVDTVGTSEIVYAGTSGGGLYRSKDGGDTWVAINTGRIWVEQKPETTPPRWLSINKGLPSTVVRAISVFGASETHCVLAGTDDGLYFRDNQREEWTLVLGSKNHLIQALQQHVMGTEVSVVAATDQGMYQVVDPAAEWSSIGGSQQQPPQSLLLVGSALLVGTPTGVTFYWTEEQSTDENQSGEQIWRSQPSALGHSVQALVALPNDRWLAATPEGVFVLLRSGDRGWVFEANDEAEPKARLPINILALAAKEGEIYGGSRFIDFALASPVQPSQLQFSEWPNFKIRRADQIDLDTLYSQVVPDSWLVIIDGLATDEKVIAHTGAIAKVQSAQTLERKEFGLDTQITRLAINPVLANKALFNLRTAQVLIQSEQLFLALEPLSVKAQQHRIFQDPLRQKQILLSQYVAHLQPQQPVLIRGKHPQAKVTSVGGIFRSAFNSTLLQAVTGDESFSWQVNNTG